MDIGELIRKTRKAKGISQQQLATRAGTTQAVISRLERNEHSPTFDTLERLLLVMGERAELQMRALERDYDQAHHSYELRQTVAQRLHGAINSAQFNRRLYGSAT